MDEESLRRQPEITPFIMGALALIAVQMAVDLDRQVCGRAEEIEDVGADGMLTSKRRLAGESPSQT